MNLAAGTRLGPYAIERAIGAGGMGVVYRADDKRLGRKVAIKLLPSAKGEYFRRFEREARTIGNLNHPNLLTLFDVGEHDGTPYLVTEMLDGQSLRERLARGPLGLREAIRIAAEVARGLAAAHDAGVIHRDVKPDNIYLTVEGRTKILDFGIAKLRRSTLEMKAVDGNEPTATPTTAETGVIIGTPGYMAPEQLEGDKVDERTDIFALGVVLYEMICGKRAFAAESTVEESYAILRTTPEPPKGATKSLARVVLRCLEKKPDARFQSATDLAFALDELDASTDPISRISKVSIEPAAMAPTVRDQRAAALPLRRRWWLAIVGAAAVAAGTAGILVGRALAPSTTPAPAPAATAPAVPWPSLVEGGPEYHRATFHGEVYSTARLAPDGASILYSAKRDGKDQILRTQLANPSILPVRAPGRLLDISAKGELAVLTEDAGGTLSRVVEGAGVRAVADHVTDATWLPDDSLAIVRDGRALEAPIGTPIVTRTTGQLTMLRASSDGQWFAFAEQMAVNDSRGKVVIVDRKGAQVAATGDQSGLEGVAWSPDGTEVWFSNGQTLYALDRRGHTRVVLRGAIRTTIMDTRAGKALIAASDLRLKLFTGPRTGGGFREAGWFDSSEIEGMSRDGSTLAFVEAAGTGIDPSGAYAHFIRRGSEPAAQLFNAYGATLLPDASALIAVASPTALTRVPTGVGTPTAIPIAPIANLEIGDRPVVSWSGRYAVVRGAEAGKPPQLWRIDLEQPSAAIPIAADTGGRHPISPDGTTVAIPHAAGGIALVDVAGAKPLRVLAGSAGEEPISFHANGRAIFTMRLAGSAIQLDHIDLASGARAAWATLSPDQRPVYFSVLLSGDGEVVSYSTNADASDLYVLQPAAK